MKNLWHQVDELLEAVRRLHSIRKAEKELDSWLEVQSIVDPQPNSQKH